MKADSKSIKQENDRKLLNKLPDLFPDKKKDITIAGETYTYVELHAELKGKVDSYDAAVAAKQDWAGKLMKSEQAETTFAPVRKALKSHVAGMFGASNPAVADYGVTPRKQRTAPDAKTTAAAVEKRAATREARHTMGKKQKQGIKGVPQQTTAQPPAQSQTTQQQASQSQAPMSTTQQMSTDAVMVPAWLQVVAPSGSSSSASSTKPASQSSNGASQSAVSTNAAQQNGVGSNGASNGVASNGVASNGGSSGAP